MTSMATTMGQQYRFNSFNSMTPFNSFNSQHMNWAPTEPISCSKVTDKLVNELQIFMHKSAMQMHSREAHRAEVKPHQCQQCLKSFSSNHQLVQHIRVHTGEKPYKCSYCDRRFKQLSHVQQHTRLHTGERPYKCHMPDCGRAFIQLSNLQQHLRNHDTQLERMKNRPFHCNICGKGFATESSLRTHTSKPCHQFQHAALVGGPNAVNCPQCTKLFLNGEQLMEHMKFTHRDPNASGVAAKRRTASHSCPVCGKHYVNEGSLRKHLACHPETSQFTSSLRMWPCSVCHAVFTHESGLLNHMEHMRMDPKHQFAAQYVLSRAAAERRERESLLGLAQVGLQGGGNHMGMGMGMGMGMSMGMGMGMPHQMQHQTQHQTPAAQMPMAASPSTQSDASSRMSTPAEKMDGTLGRMPSPSDALRSISSHHDVMNHMRPHGGDNMRAMISQSQAELVKSTLTSQAETIRSVMASQAEAIRSLAGSHPNHQQQQQQQQPQPQQQQQQQQQQAHHPPEPMASPQPDLRDMRMGGQNNMEAALRSQAAETALRLANHEVRPPSQQGDLGDALRLQEVRMEQALRLHSDPRSLSTSLPGPLGFSLSQAQQQAQQQSA